jgi:glutamine synthetase
MPAPGDTSLLGKFLLSNPEVKFIHYQFLDFGGVLREMVVVAAQAEIHASENKPHNCSCLLLRMLPNGHFSPRFVGIGKEYLWPDWTSLRLARFMGAGKTHAIVMCFIDEGIGLGNVNSGTKSCPRSILKRAVDSAKLDGLEFQIGFETEFILLDKDKSDVAPTGITAPTSWCAAAGMQHPGVTECIEEIATCVLDSGIQLLAFHSESGIGEYEFITAPTSVMEAVDEQIYVRQAIQTISQRHGFRATLYPAPYGPGSTNGAHCHLSINNAASDVADHFLAGILDRLPALCAFTLPVHDSYHRIAELKGRAGKWVAWGTENKDLPVRGILGRVGYWEFRSADYTANTYIQLAAWITAGHLGVQEEAKLRCKDANGSSITFQL